MRISIGILVALLVVLFVANMVMFKVREWEQVVVIQFGEPVRVHKEPGLKFKLPPPFQKVVVFSNQLLDYDSDPSAIPTKDKKFLVLDNYARWHITDPLVFLKAMRTRSGALARLDDIIYSEVRNELGQHTLSEIVSQNREALMLEVTKRSNKAAQAYGIEVIDVRIKRADLPPENEAAVFNRMRAEREREAKRYRAEGEEQALKIRAETDLEAAQINAEAYEKAQGTRGEGDAEALRTYASAYKNAAAFYEFTRTLEAFEKSLDENTLLVQPADTDFFKYLKGPQ
jgi:membrane protease subunit HflC